MPLPTSVPSSSPIMALSLFRIPGPFENLAKGANSSLHFVWTGFWVFLRLASVPGDVGQQFLVSCLGCSLQHRLESSFPEDQSSSTWWPAKSQPVKVSSPMWTTQLCSELHILAMDPEDPGERGAYIPSSSRGRRELQELVVSVCTIFRFAKLVHIS